jgi:hypothetical protein
MTTSIRTAYPNWPRFNERLRDVVAGLTPEQLAIRPSPDRWPIWASIGHLACQRVSGLSGLADVPGAEATPFPDALWRCPGDEYLEPAMDAAELADALDATFRLIEHALDTWAPDTLDAEIRHVFGDEEIVTTRGRVIERSLAHDVYHIAELNETLVANGLPFVDLWAD